MFAVSSVAQGEDEENKSLDIALVTCDQSTGVFTLKYDVDNDDLFSQPIFPKNCKLNNSKYKVTGERGPFSQSRCGAQPPIFIELSRNGTPIVTDAVFGDNCFLGPAISEVEITERKGKIHSIKLCIFRELESPMIGNPEFKPVCKYFSGSAEIKKALPITQSKVNDFLHERKR
jgi:hypothetical protein